uniref:Uncharacterized protein n=1 Tax=Arundo donax TaxID=35708 RepID=A0A0A9DKP8_ARUDO
MKTSLIMCRIEMGVSTRIAQKVAMLCSAKGFSREMHASRTRGVRRKQCSSQLVLLFANRNNKPRPRRILVVTFEPPT